MPAVLTPTIINPGSGRASTPLQYRFMEGRVPFFARLFDATLVLDCQNSWLEVYLRSRTIITLFIDAGATFSGRFQACYDKNGINWFDVIPEAGSTTTANPITNVSAPGFWIFSGPYYYLRFNPTAIATNTVHADAATMAL